LCYCQPGWENFWRGAVPYCTVLVLSSRVQSTVPAMPEGYFFIIKRKKERKKRKSHSIATFPKEILTKTRCRFPWYYKHTKILVHTNGGPSVPPAPPERNTVCLRPSRCTSTPSTAKSVQHLPDCTYRIRRIFAHPPTYRRVVGHRLWGTGSLEDFRDSKFFLESSVCTVINVLLTICTT